MSHSSPARLLESTPYGLLQGFKPEPEIGDYVYRYESHMTLWNTV